METPTIVLLAFAVSAGMVALFNLRFLKGIWRRKDEPGKDMDDEWDPFG